MSTLVDQAPLCPRLIGRDAYVGVLCQALDRARSGQGQVVLVSGEAGIGKSRLLKEAIPTAIELGYSVAHSACFEPDRQLPYAPIVELLRALVAGWSAEHVCATLAATELDSVARLLPELALAPPHQTHGDGSERERRYVGQALLSLASRKAADRPLVLVVEDVHWSDDASLEALQYLARRIAHQPIALLATYRSDEAAPTLSHVVAELRRERLASELHLAPLSAADVLGMLRATLNLPHGVHPDLSETIFSLTEGNPFFVEEVLGTLVADGAIVFSDGRWIHRRLDVEHVPHTVQDAVQRRLKQLSEAARRTLTLAAIVGRRFDFALLQALTSAAERDLVSQLRELIRANLVVELPGDQFAFRHALTRDAISGELLGRERRALHQRIAEVLEQRHAASPDDTALEDLAAQFAAGGRWDKAIVYAERAASRARGLHLPRAVVDQLTCAIDAAARLAKPVNHALYLARGEAHELLGHFDLARADYDAALTRARENGDRAAEWQALIACGLLWSARDYDRAADCFARALELARGLDDSRLVARSLNRLGNLHQNLGRPGQAEMLHQQALAIVVSIPDQLAVAETLDLLGTAASIRGDLPAAKRYYDQALNSFRAMDQRQAVASTAAMLCLLGGSLFHDTVPVADSSLAEVRQLHDEALRNARAIGWRSGEAFASISIGLALAHRGQYQNALAKLQGGLALATEIEHVQWTTCGTIGLGALYFKILDSATAIGHLEAGLRSAREMRSRHWIELASGLLASAFVAVGRVAQASELLQEALRNARTPHTRPQRAQWCAAIEVALAQADGDRALQLVEQLLATPDFLPGVVIPRLWFLRAEALAAKRQWPAATALLEEARSAAERQCDPGWVWRIDAALGRVLTAREARREVEQARRRARECVQQLASGFSDSLMADAFRERAIAQLDSGRPSLPRHASQREFGGLSGREQQVARLVALGMTNRQVARELVIAEHTAERHVENILAKLGLSSRVQIATWAIDHGLTDLGGGRAGK